MPKAAAGVRVDGGDAVRGTDGGRNGADWVMLMLGWYCMETEREKSERDGQGTLHVKVSVFGVCLWVRGRFRAGGDVGGNGVWV